MQRDVTPVNVTDLTRLKCQDEVLDILHDSIQLQQMLFFRRLIKTSSSKHSPDFLCLKVGLQRCERHLAALSRKCPES